MVQKLQFADNMNNDFDSVDTIVDNICENFSNEEEDSFKILIPLLVRQKMKTGLQIRDGESFRKIKLLNVRFHQLFG